MSDITYPTAWHTQACQAGSRVLPPHIPVVFQNPFHRTENHIVHRHEREPYTNRTERLNTQVLVKFLKAHSGRSRCLKYSRAGIGSCVGFGYRTYEAYKDWKFAMVIYTPMPPRLAPAPSTITFAQDPLSRLRLKTRFRSSRAPATRNAKGPAYDKAAPVPEQLQFQSSSSSSSSAQFHCPVPGPGPSSSRAVRSSSGSSWFQLQGSGSRTGSVVLPQSPVQRSSSSVAVPVPVASRGFSSRAQGSAQAAQFSPRVQCSTMLQVWICARMVTYARRGLRVQAVNMSYEGTAASPARVGLRTVTRGTQIRVHRFHRRHTYTCLHHHHPSGYEYTFALALHSECRDFDGFPTEYACRVDARPQCSASLMTEHIHAPSVDEIQLCTRTALRVQSLRRCSRTVAECVRLRTRSANTSASATYSPSAEVDLSRRIHLGALSTQPTRILRRIRMRVQCAYAVGDSALALYSHACPPAAYLCTGGSTDGVHACVVVAHTVLRVRVHCAMCVGYPGLALDCECSGRKVYSECKEFTVGRIRSAACVAASHRCVGYSVLSLYCECRVHSTKASVEYEVRRRLPLSTVFVGGVSVEDLTRRVLLEDATATELDEYRSHRGLSPSSPALDEVHWTATADESRLSSTVQVRGYVYPPTAHIPACPVDALAVYCKC
ncbi:hypothetical protein DFP72DRAFT_858696 [Ephemerocybe angulata]|uniref:Uncharacterized protein n=1 Tax=Ephemerocybe angulata TaxID=980116 RepID=A0A8H6LWU1_9AGAR|nr:hypothetical protein DFP72DRAFT_858696 [Tulosesus angulatus]